MKANSGARERSDTKTAKLLHRAASGGRIAWLRQLRKRSLRTASQWLLRWALH